MAERAAADPPRLLQRRDLQAPVRVSAGGLLFLAGGNLRADDTVSFRPLDGGTPLAAELVPGTADANALVARVPSGVDAATRYAIDVVGSSGERAAPALVNDARPLWFLPLTLPARGADAGLGREIKIVGRNLAPAGIPSTAVRLRGPRSVALATLPAPADTGIEDFVVRALVPEDLPLGDYRIDVTRDGRNWVTLDDPLRIEALPKPAAVFDVADPRFGACAPDDDRDDLDCVLAALNGAAARGGEVRFAPGTWDLDAIGERSAWSGIVVPAGVSLRGAANLASRLRVGRAGVHATFTLFTLTGRNRVSGLVFEDRGPAVVVEQAAFLRLGRRWNEVPAGTSLSHITIEGNLFQGRTLSVADAGLPIRGLVITHNRFRARRLALSLGGDSRNERTTYRIEQAVIAHNVFEPGSYLDVRNRQGTFASEIGAGERLDFSDNVADGAATAGLDSPGDARGWRAAFFWHLQGPQERVLISRNDIRCSGDKAGDGEAIALDNTHNTSAFDDARNVIAADADRVSILGPAANPTRDYRGHWVQVAAGPGLGQSRRIVAVTRDPATLRTTFVISPGWDVVPVAGSSRISVGRTFWQTLITGNVIDERTPRCQHANRNGPFGGGISVWAQTSDSTVAFNRQFATNGITIQQLFATDQTIYQYFLDVRGNRIEGAYDPRRGLAGISGSHGAAPDRATPVAAFGVTISDNDISLERDATQAAISNVPTWYRGPEPHSWLLVDRPLIFDNRLGDSRRGVDRSSQPLVRGTVLSGNRCANASDLEYGCGH
jgi:hypothetical protein